MPSASIAAGASATLSPVGALDTSLLEQAHAKAKQADSAILSDRPQEAAQLYASASAAFGELREATHDAEAKRMLELLQLKYLRIATQLALQLQIHPGELFASTGTDASTAPGPTANSTTVSSPTASAAAAAAATATTAIGWASSLASSLAAARGIPSSSPTTTAASSSPSSPATSTRTPSAPVSKGFDDLINAHKTSLDASLNKLFQSAANVRAAYDGLQRQLLHEGASAASLQALPAFEQPMAFGGGVMDSFFMVPDVRRGANWERGFDDADTRKLLRPRLSSDGHTDRLSAGDDVANAATHLYDSLKANEAALKRQRDMLMSSVTKLKVEMRARESRRSREYESKLERLEAENEKLKISNGRLKKKWLDLEETARTKRAAANAAAAAATASAPNDDER
ncbi:uncharacterized protein V1518DRAFT_410473 [Limtongia smithiae]|uniref:uncharacterized protein n=1 Tax=Limtongia smithiae TaxID=1125753 RepID=UPI0034CF169A